MCSPLGDFVLHSTFVRRKLTTDVWRIVSAKQRGKAAACFKLEQSTSTVSDGGMHVGGKKPHQQKHKRAGKNLFAS